jgi:hypothetical protein
MSARTKRAKIATFKRLASFAGVGAHRASTLASSPARLSRWPICNRNTMVPPLHDVSRWAGMCREQRERGQTTAREDAQGEPLDIGAAHPGGSCPSSEARDLPAGTVPTVGSPSRQEPSRGHSRPCHPGDRRPPAPARHRRPGSRPLVRRATDRAAEQRRLVYRLERLGYNVCLEPTTPRGGIGAIVGSQLAAPYQAGRRLSIQSLASLFARVPCSLPGSSSHTWSRSLGQLYGRHPSRPSVDCHGVLTKSLRCTRKRHLPRCRL